MSKSQPLLDFYESFAAALFIQFDEEGLANIVIPDANPTPMAIGDNRVVLPTPQILKDGLGAATKRVAFHPLSENIMRGESDIFKFIKRMAAFRFNYTATIIAEELAKIAADPELQAPLNPAQQAFLVLMDQTKPVDLTKVDSINQAVVGGRSLINMYMQRTYPLDGIEYRRVCMVNFPILDELDRDDKVIFDVDCGSKRAKGQISALFKYIIGDLDPNAYSVGVDSSTAPYLTAMLESFYLLAKQLNSLIKLFGKSVPQLKQLIIPVDWYKQMKHLDAYRDFIRPLAGNEGTTVAGEEVEERVEEKPKRQVKLPSVTPSKPASAKVEEEDDDLPWDDPKPQSRRVVRDVEPEPSVDDSGEHLAKWKSPSAAPRVAPLAQGTRPGYQRPGASRPSYLPDPDRNPFQANQVRQPQRGGYNPNRRNGWQ